MGSSQPHLSGKRLLIVDDNPTNLQILLAQTRGWGMISIPAASGAEALELLRQAEGQPFDLAILDMTMPEMDGMRLVDEIRQIERAQSGYPLRRLALVMLASLGRSGNDPRLREFSACLSKPVKASQLYNSLVNIFASGTPAPGLADTLPGGVPSGAAGYDTYMADRPPAEVTGPLRILLAEDNSTNQKLAVLMLERMGYRPDVAANGLEVLDALHRQPYDVILMDVLMPEMDGLEATRIIRKEYATLNQPAARTQPAAQDQLAAIDQPAATTQRAVTDQPAATPQPAAEVQPYIIAMTANVLQGDRERCLEAGMSGYLGKPIHFRELAEAILRCKPGESGLPAAPVPGQAAPAAAQRAGPAEILDPAAWSRLQAMLGAKAGEMLPMLIDTFLREAVQLQEEAVQAVEQEKHTDLRRAAHTLKSNAANFGATALAAACLELENIGRNNTVAGAVDLLVKVGIEFEQVKEALLTARGQVVIPHPLPPLPKGEGNSC